MTQKRPVNTLKRALGMAQNDPKNTSADKKSRCRWLDGGKNDPRNTLILTPKSDVEI